jgi:predicted Na+-dependent transporter
MKKRIVTLLVSLVALISFFMFVQPEGKSLIFIFIPVVLSWVLLFSLAQLITAMFFKEKSTFRSIITFVSVSLIILLILLSGVDQLTITDVILASGLVLISSFYFYRMWS